MAATACRVGRARRKQCADAIGGTWARSRHSEFHRGTLTHTAAVHHNTSPALVPIQSQDALATHPALLAAADSPAGELVCFVHASGSSRRAHLHLGAGQGSRIAARSPTCADLWPGWRWRSPIETEHRLPLAALLCTLRNTCASTTTLEQLVADVRYAASMAGRGGVTGRAPSRSVTGTDRGRSLPAPRKAWVRRTPARWPSAGCRGAARRKTVLDEVAAAIHADTGVETRTVAVDLAGPT